MSEINVIFFASQNLTVHITKSQKANELYLSQYGKLLIPVLNPDIT